MKQENAYHFIRSLLWFAVQECGQQEDGEDVIQDVSIKVLQRVDWFDALPDREKTAYVMRSIRNKNVDNRRKRKRQMKHYHPAFDTKYSHPDAYDKIELKETMHRGRQHPFFKSLCLFISGYDSREIAEQEGVTPNTLRGRFHYARKFLGSY